MSKKLSEISIFFRKYSRNVVDISRNFNDFLKNQPTQPEGPHLSLFRIFVDLKGGMRKTKCTIVRSNESSRQFFRIFSLNFWSLNSGFPRVFCFRGFRKPREACRKHFHLISCKSTDLVRSYDQKPNKNNDNKTQRLL